MPDFTYEALDRSGKPTTGTVSARDSSDAAVKVRALGVFPTRIGTGSGKAATNGADGHEARNGKASARATSCANAAVTSCKKIGLLLILLFTREVADLLDAG